MIIWKNQLLVDWIDRYGRDYTTNITLQDDTPLDTSPYTSLISALRGASRAGTTVLRLQRVAVITSAPSTGPYDTALDQALLIGRSAAGRVIRTRIPAPHEGYVTGDDEEIDVSDSRLVAVESALVSLASDTGGSAYSELRRGRRVMSPLSR